MKKLTANFFQRSELQKWTQHLKFISFFTIIILMISANVKAQFSNPFAPQPSNLFVTQSAPVADNGKVKWILNPENSPEVAQWETIQSTKVNVASANDPTKFFKVSFDLDQVRNGGADKRVDPADWVNGNAGSSNAHYAEGYSIPYRMKIDDLPRGSFSVDIEWDIRQSSSSAIDFITHYNLIDFPVGSHAFNFGHVAEVINPIIELGTWIQGLPGPPSGIVGVPDGLIPKPNFGTAPAAVGSLFDAIQALSENSNVGIKGRFTIWNADITGFQYISQGSVTAAASSTRLRIFFNNNDVVKFPTLQRVVIAWGGHIAKGVGVWGEGNSATAVSGSPYHTRIIEWDPDGAGAGGAASVGNQDRSLSADAVQDPPICTLDGPGSLQCSANGTFTSGVAASDLGSGQQAVTPSWEVSGCGASIVSSDVATAVISAGSQCGCTFTVSYTLKKNGLNVSPPCTLPVVVTDNTAPTFTGTYTNGSLGCNPVASDLDAALGTATASDNCGSPTLSRSDGSVTGTCTRSQTRTFTARDACGNTTTTSRTVTWTQDNTGPTFTGSYQSVTVNGCNPVASDLDAALGTATATDNCGIPTLSKSDGGVTGTCTRSQTRTFTARDACGNSTTTSRTITWTQDNTPPFISCPNNQTVQCAADVQPTGTASVTTSDNCGAAVTVSQVGGDAFSNSTCANRYTITRTFRATDGCGNTATCAQTITVNDNTPPQMTCPAPVSVQCASSVPNPAASDVTTTDNCVGSVGVVHVRDAVSNSTCPNKYTITRIYRATDACGNTNTCSQIITVNDNTAPTITCPADVVIECSVSTSDLTATGSATASDNCGPVTPTYTDNIQTRGCIKYTQRTWKAVDACGNSASCLQNITQTDNTPPVFVCVTTVGGNPTSVTATDNCTASADIVTYLKNGVWTAIDGSGNIRTATSASLSVCAGSNRMAPTQNTGQTTDQTPGTTTTIEGKKGVSPTKAMIKDLAVQAFPNPFNDRVKFVVNSPESGYATLEILNVTGQKLKTVYTGQLPAGQKTFDMVLPTRNTQTLVYILKMNGKQVTGKLIQAAK